MTFQDYGIGNFPLNENETGNNLLDVFSPPVKDDAILSSKFTEVRLLTVLDR